MFPLADGRQRILGFGARAVRPEQRPKYLNTSESELYQKGRQLFGIDHARAAAAKAGRIIAVEGYTDVLALHQAGITETVAIMGTALTPDQLARARARRGRHRVPRARRRQRRPRSDAAARAGCARARHRAARRQHARGLGPGRPGRRRGSRWLPLAARRRTLRARVPDAQHPRDARTLEAHAVATARSASCDP